MKQPIIYPYKLGSASAKKLVKALHTKLVRSNGNYVYKPNHLVINWGSGVVPTWNKFGSLYRNYPSYLGVNKNKLNTFLQLKDVEGVNIPPFCQTKEEAKQILAKGKVVVCRTLLRSRCGKGIVLANTEEELVNAKLYTQYIRKAKEFRVHVYRGKAFDVQQKRKRKNYDGEINGSVRNYANGWVYCRENLEIPDGLKEMAVKAVDALDMDFGAVDIIWNKKQNKCYVLEVNSAPGLTGATINSYVQEIINDCIAD